MVQYLEELLHEKTKGSQSSVLFAQWSYDKKIVPSALQAVSNLFPHYSLHDESHSITIINNIVRILGKNNLNKLSSIDIWLILEAAYWHDLGMVVSGEKLIESIKSPEFIQFFKELIADKKHALHEFAIKLEVIDGKLKAKEKFYSLELNDGVKFILAEFFRWRHADRSENIINNPLQEIHVKSPRTVIPQRIFKILGSICSSHTKDFDDVIKLPFCEVGIDIEDAHPRFVACLLRIGDLLDLDNNRFSEVMLRTLTRIPIDTLNHKAKHLSIESFRVDREKIEITAKCEDYETANITQHWFNYLNSEISSQMVNWNDIVPTQDLGYLPTIGTLKVELKNYEFIDGKHKPQFSVDTDKALSLLQGAGIYNGPHQSIREILQNSVDSSLIRIWLEYKNYMNFDSPIDERFKDIANNYSIHVNIVQDEFVDEWKRWKIEICDQGTGISKKDLKYLMSTGSSSKNYERINIVEEMPSWMKPSGTFGIGFQSIFMLTDEIRIETKSFFDEQNKVIELNSPNSKKDGGVLIKNVETNHSVKPGVKLSFVYKTKLIPGRFSFSINSNASRITESYDPFLHHSLDVEIGKIIDEVYGFSGKSYLPVKIKFNGEDLDENYDKYSFNYYDDKNKMEMNIFLNQYDRFVSLQSYYKNQKVDNSINDIKFLRFEVNIHKDSATKVLTINRNKIRDEYKSKLEEDVLRSSIRVIVNNFDQIADNDESKIVYSMYLDYYSDDKIKNKYGINRFNNWKDMSVKIDDGDIMLGELLSRINKLEIIFGNSQVYDKEKYTLNNDTLTICLPGDWTRNYYTEFLIKKISKEFKGVVKNFSNDQNFKQIDILRDGNDTPLIELKDVLTVLKNREYFTSRSTIPCVAEFMNLRVNDKATLPYLGRYRVSYRVPMVYPKMVSPFVVSEKRGGKGDRYIKRLNSKLYDWVYENRYYESVTRDEIINLYDEFCQSIDLDSVNKYLKEAHKKNRDMFG